MQLPLFSTILHLTFVWVYSCASVHGQAAFDREGWRYALPGVEVRFPIDHRVHREFRTEWWYFTGNLTTASKERFGYQVTFFRYGLRLPSAVPVHSRFVMDDLKFGHFAITEVGRNAFRFHQEVARGAFGEAGFGVSGGDERRLAWLNDWSLIEEPDGSAWRLSAMQPTARISLRLVPAKRWVLHGAQGLSTKSAEAGNASYYYSGTRLRTEGSIEWLGADGLVARTERVAGESWFDHEWASSQLGPQQVGWDWFSLQLADGTELMLYQLRNKDGTVAPASSATWVEADGSSRHLTRSMYELTPVREWRSPHTGARYPVGWRIRIPSLAFEAEVRTPVENQELRVAPISYWEGVIDIEGKRAGLPIGGHGYLELTGYSGPVVGLQPVGTDGASSLGNNPGFSKKLQP